jgi:tRNA nucleotidyltransferase/poly(A) polymerase
MKIYLVGGAVRDRFLGLPAKDKDYAIEAFSYEEMKNEFLSSGGKIYLERPEFFTIRGNLPETGPADFTLCRKDGFYSDGRRPDSVSVGNIFDDLSRRDMTINAIAINIDTNEVIDPFKGIEDIQSKTLRAVGDPIKRISEDYLRILRFLRFSITKGFNIHSTVHNVLIQDKYIAGLKNISTQRIRDELFLMFSHNTLKTIDLLGFYKSIRNLIFNETEIWLEPTLKSK